MAQPIAPVVPAISVEDETLELVREMVERLARIESTLDHYKPLLAMAEQRMTGPKFFGRGAPRVTQGNQQ